MSKPPVDKSPKSTQVEMDRRISEFQTLLLNGYTRSHLLQHAAEKWNVAERTADTYIAKAGEIIKEVNRASLEENLAIIVTNLWHQLRQARKTQDHGECRQILMAIAKLKGLDQERVLHSFESDKDFADMPDTELDKILAGNG